MKPVRVLFHVDSLGFGGLERKVTQVALGLNRERFEPIVSYSWEWGIHGEELARAGIPVHEIIPRPAKKRGVEIATRKIRDLRPDIFHTFSCRQNAQDVIVAHRAKVPVIISARDNVRHWAPAGPARDWEFTRNHLTDFVTPCCEAAAHLCRTVEVIRPDRIAVIHNGVDLPQPFEGPSIREELGLPADAFVIGYAARYRPLKKHHTLLDALRKLVKRRPNIHLVCCGENDEGLRQRLQQMVCDLSLESHITLLSARQNMSAFYRGLDLYVHASGSEALSLAILEAMGHGLAVVATSVGGTAEAVVEQITGLLIPPSNSDAIAEAVIGLMDRPETRSRWGAAGRERVRKEFSVARMVEGYESLYSRVIEPSPVPHRIPLVSLRYTGSPDSRELTDTTIFVTTIGDEANFSDCMAHLRAQTVRCRIEVIEDVAPMAAAFKRMHRRCVTPYYVQVDEDMLLYPETIARLHDLLEQSPPDVAMVCAPLWDCDVERPILGIKIYRHAIVKRFPYGSSISFEVKQLNRMTDAGYRAILLSTEEHDAVCMGEHGKHYTPKTIFQRWQKLFQRHHHLGHLTWLEPWPARLMKRYATTRDPVHLYALLGAIAGITAPPVEKDFDFRDTNQALERVKYYFPTGSESEP